VLLAVLVVIVVLTLAAYQFSELMSAEYQAADSYTRAAQARTMADSGIHYTAALLSNPDAFTNTLNSNPFDNTQAFQSIVVQPNGHPRLQGRFSIVAPLDPDDPAFGTKPYRWGVTDESGRINLNTLMKLDSSGQIAHDMLMKLPNMTEDIVNAILDWIDPDDEPRSNGAESDYYSTLNPPYRAKNGPLDSLEELLMVKGVTPQILFGNDRNRNGTLDPDEDDGSGTLNRGLASYLTIYSRERNVDSSGNARVYINDSNLDTLYQKLTTALGQDLANYILAYRLYGPAASQSGSGSRSGSGSQPGSSPQPTGSGASPSTGTRTPASDNDADDRGATSTGSRSSPNTATPARSGGSGGGSSGGTARLTRGNLGNFQQGQPRTIASLFELVNSQVEIPSDDPQAPPTRYPSPLNDAGSLRQLLPLLLDKTTTVKGTELPARINVNTASRTVLSTLPNLTDADVQTILDHRPDPSATEAPDPIFQTLAWLITEANFSPQSLRSIERYITGRSQVYRVQSLGYFDGGGPTARIEAVIDTNGGRPRIIYWRDLTELGKGFNLQSNP
jgi:type II secretory pathway component PulK